MQWDLHKTTTKVLGRLEKETEEEMDKRKEFYGGWRM